MILSGQSLLTALFFCSITSAHAFDTFVPKCYKNDLSLSKCLEDAANKYLRELNADGLEVGFDKDIVAYTEKQPPLEATFLYRKVKFYNLTSSNLTLSYNRRTKTIYGKINVPYTRANCYFDITGKFGKVDLQGGGNSDFFYWDIQASFIFRIIRGEDGRIELEPLYYNVDNSGRRDMIMYDIVAPTYELGETLRMVTKHFGDVIMGLTSIEDNKAFEKAFTDIGSQVVRRILHDGVYQIN